MKFSHLNRIYCNKPMVKNGLINLEKNCYNYLKNVLRFRVGSEFRIFNEKDGEFLVKIINITKNSIEVKINELLRKVESKPKFSLALSVIKSEKMLIAVKAAVQLGVSEIVPIISARSQQQNINFERFNRCIIEATEQSEQISLTKLLQPVSLDTFLQRSDIEQIIFANETENKNTIKSLDKFSDDLAILIGPEGGFTDQERAILHGSDKVDSVTLGNTVLRTEIAVISAIACVQMMKL